MYRTLSFTMLFLFASILPASAERYAGQVGKLKAVFDIEWGGDKSVGGTYRYPSRKGVVYTLDGEFAADGKLVLREYTDGTLTAVMMLRNTSVADKLRWSGTMKNTDGRELDMWFGE
jgi:hypothetical protein